MHLLNPELQSWQFYTPEERLRPEDTNLFQHFIWGSPADDFSSLVPTHTLAESDRRKQVVVAYQPPWILSPTDLKEFTTRRSVSDLYFLSRGPTHTKAFLVPHIPCTWSRLSYRNRKLRTCLGAGELNFSRNWPVTDIRSCGIFALLETLAGLYSHHITNGSLVPFLRVSFLSKSRLTLVSHSFMIGWSVGFTTPVYEWNSSSPTIIELLAFWTACAMNLTEDSPIPKVCESDPTIACQTVCTMYDAMVQDKKAAIALYSL